MGFHEGWWSCGRFLINHLGEEIILHWQAMWCMDTFVHMHTWRFSSVIHEMYGCKWVDSVSGCVRGAYRGGEGRVKVRRREVSFICIWHTSLLCYSDSTIILITVCLPLPPPSSSPLPTSVSTDKKDDVSTERFAALSALLFPSELWKSPICAGTGVPFLSFK